MLDPIDPVRVSPTVLPTGTVTFLMTDIEGSTRMLQMLGDRYPELLADHYRLLWEAFGAAGTEVGTEGDALFFVFSDAPSAVRAALEGQRRLAAYPWPPGGEVRVRMGIHSGEGILLDNSYVGLDVHRAARITTSGHGGQVLLSDAARALAEGSLPEGVGLRDLGEHRLKDLERSEYLFQLEAHDLAAEFPPLRALGARHNLPAQVTGFVGRTREKQHVLELLGSSRLLTLTGSGGTGKTRLALEVAAASLDDFVDGIFFVPLAPISDADLVVPTVASTLGVRESPARPIRDALIEHLGERAVLLVLDNFEQLLAAAPTVGELLAAAPRVKALVTSREPLRISGEQEFPVPPLALPDVGAQTGLDELQAIDSAALFLQRARSIRPGFDLTPENAQAVAEICARLDGLPLAIELAAARLRLFEPGELLPRLDRCLSVLAGGRDLPERQRTLRGAIDWSHQLLDEPEQALFRRLSVFRGGCTLEALEAVCVPEELALDPVDAVSSLHDKSLLRRADASAGGLRVTMLETIRQYGQERLEASGEAQEIGRRHAGFFLELAERVAGGLQGREEQGWVVILDRELDNFRAAIGWSIDAGEMETGLRLAAALNRFWLFGNHVKEGRQHLDELLSRPRNGVSATVCAAALGAAADLAGWQGDYEKSRPLAEESLAISRELGDVGGIAGQLANLGYAAVIPDPAAALKLFRDSIEAYRRAGGPPDMGQALIGLALPEMQLGNLEGATRHLDEATVLFERAGQDGMALISLGLLGVCSRLEGDLAAARQRYVDVLVRSNSAGAYATLTLPLAALADLALLEGDAERAAVLGAAEAQLGERLGGTPSFQLMGIPDVLERARAELSDHRYQAALALGRSAHLDEIVTLALSGATDAKAAPG
jgi:predicted ATPase/class 3 adenylate cyclase